MPTANSNRRPPALAITYLESTMPHGILRIQRGDETRYLMWSTIVDAPISYALTEAEVIQFIREDAADTAERSGRPHLERAKAHGTSWHHHGRNADDMIANNRAGDDETTLTLAEIIDRYWDAPDFETTPSR